MGVLIKIILVSVLIYLLGKSILKGVLYYLFGSATKNLNERMKWHEEEILKQSRKKQGKITIDYNPETGKTFGKDDGDYVDYEEVK